MLIKRALPPLLALALLPLLLVPATGRAQSNEDCLGCHGQKDFTTERKGKPVSLYVNDYNTRARRLYQGLGFRTVGELATVLY